MSRPLRTAAVVCAVAAIPVAVAIAEPARKATLGPAASTFKWQGSGSGILAVQDVMDAVGCTPGIHDCDDTLIKVEAVGTLTVKTSGGGPAAIDTDLQLFASDEAGVPGTQLKESAAATPTTEEAVSADVDPGYYIARIDYAIGTGAVDGEATFEPAAAAPGGADSGTPAAANPAPSSKVSQSSKAKSKSLKGFKGSAKDDGSVAKVEIGLLQLGSGGKCKQLTASGSFATVSGRCTEPTVFLAAKGTTSWTFKLRKPLKKGKYLLFARATDDKGLTEQGFGSGNRRAFTVK
jgi:hypothetical protein